MTIAVIGAGASGMMAALQAAWRGGNVTLLEGNPEVGRKLLVTGSGRCNITNAAAAAAAYSCADPKWMETLLDQFGVHDLLDALSEIGVLVYHTSDGWYYPLSNSAHTVVDAFQNALRSAGVKTLTSTRVSSIRNNGGGFLVGSVQEDREAEQEFERGIVSAGGAAYPSLGSRGELFPVLQRMGLAVQPKRPALAPILVELGDLLPLKGVRLDMGVTLWNGAQPVATALGNAIFTEWGLNGPAVMDVSHNVTAFPQAKLELSLNLIAFFETEFEQLLAQKRKTSMPLRVFLGAFFPPKVAAVFMKNARLPEDIVLDRVNDRALGSLIERLKNTRLPVKGVRGFEYCQVSAGGVQVSEVNPHSLESLRVKGLYLTGETLDVVGPCGGYNLQFAFSSGAVAGRAAASAG